MSESPAERILGIWDGHDAGAALVEGERIVSAVNEERLTRRKLEIGFPTESVSLVLREAGLDASEVDRVSVSTSDFAKTLTRAFPSLREEYYAIRRRLKQPGALNKWKKLAKYKLTEISPNLLTRALSSRYLKRELTRAGLVNASLEIVPHHTAHAASAVFASGFDDCLVLTIDGIGDALSGSVWSYREDKLQSVAELAGSSSLGIFFEHVTNLLNMRELEDEGKVMALANFAYPVPDEDNPLLDFFEIKGLSVRCRYSSLALYRELARVQWHFPSEQFAFMAQRALEKNVLELVRNALEQTGHTRIAYAGGVASNVKVNMLVRELPQVEDLFVFPHMGDGGLGLGAAMWSNFEQHGVSRYSLPHVFFGPSYSEEEMRAALDRNPDLHFERQSSVALTTARLLASGEIVMWFQDEMEFGPRALGARSILALPNSLALKDRLNLVQKKRVWYQPFCPTMLENDASELLEGFNGKLNRFMTVAYRTKELHRADICGVVNVDGSCRPQILPEFGTDQYTRLLHEVRKLARRGVLLNTSFNTHGEPMVCSPDDALRTFSNTDINYLVLGDFLVQKEPPDLIA